MTPGKGSVSSGSLTPLGGGDYLVLNPATGPVSEKDLKIYFRVMSQLKQVKRKLKGLKRVWLVTEVSRVLYDKLLL